MADEKSSKKADAKKRGEKSRRKKPPAKKASAQKDAAKKRRRKKPSQKRDCEKSRESEKRAGEESRCRKQRRSSVAAPVVRASARYVRIAPRKARLIADQVRGLHIEKARALLQFSPRGAAQDIHKLIDSAAANAENNHDLIGDEMRVSSITVDEGPTLKRFRPRAHGPRDPDPQANQPHRRGADPGGGLEHGTEDPPRGFPRRLHPRLEVELVRGEKLRRRPPGRPADPRSHRQQALARRALEHHDRAPRRGRRRHPHRPPGHRDRQVGQRSRRAAQGAAQAHRQPGESEHPRGQAPRARRQAGRPVDRRAAAEPGRLPPRDETRPDLGDALRRQGRQGPGLRPPRRGRDGADRKLFRRPRAAAHAARRHRLRLLRGAHDDRPDRRQMLDQQGRSHARGLPLRPRLDRRRAAGRGSGAAIAAAVAGVARRRSRRPRPGGDRGGRGGGRGRDGGGRGGGGGR